MLGIKLSFNYNWTFDKMVDISFGLKMYMQSASDVVNKFKPKSIYTLRLHYNVVIGVHGEKTRYIHSTVVQNLERDLFHRFSHT